MTTPAQANAIGQAVRVAQSMLDGTTELLDAVRQIVTLAHEGAIADDPVVLALRGIDSELDRWPSGAGMAACSDEFRARIERERGDYLGLEADDIRGLASRLIRRYGAGR